jgi:hypothetical protein
MRHVEIDDPGHHSPALIIRSHVVNTSLVSSSSLHLLRTLSCGGRCRYYTASLLLSVCRANAETDC